MATQKSGTRSIGSTAARALAVGALVALTVRELRLAERRHTELRNAELRYAERQYAELRQRLERLEQAERRQHHTDLTNQHRLQLELLTTAMSDPDLAAVLSTIDAPPTTRRQYLFANAIYTNALHAYRVGNVSLEGLHGHLRVTCQNSIFRDYWAATRQQRASLKASSDEAKVGRMVDDLIHDLEEAETDEWWVVGEPPVE
ncbi:DUF6082 family protein [Streptomyces sp. LHD-70]|uniref:DUF6082 family protein n=1 Tax=Streptomyces sp. LHD-70 TaxID=3072140 RepID=UPI00280D00B5|nr:DUF6082 family protein [Streptomyces sp. LHD-70]MDQ8703510.1 DUF6082 family protein [Streptomyces sp. LHD-70]